MNIWFIQITTVFVETRLWKTKHLRKRFQNFRQSCVLLTDRIEIHQLQPLVWPSDLLYVMLAGCDWWISIQSVDNVYDWRKFWKRFRVCFVFQSRISTKMVVTILLGIDISTLRYWSLHYNNDILLAVGNRTVNCDLCFKFQHDCKSENRSAPLVLQISLYQNLQQLPPLHFLYCNALPCWFDLRYFTQWGKGKILFL